MANGSGPVAIVELALDLLDLTLGLDAVVDALLLRKTQSFGCAWGQRRNTEEATAPREREGGPAGYRGGWVLLHQEKERGRAGCRRGQRLRETTGRDMAQGLMCAPLAP